MPSSAASDCGFVQHHAAQERAALRIGVGQPMVHQPVGRTLGHGHRLLPLVQEDAPPRAEVRRPLRRTPARRAARGSALRSVRSASRQAASSGPLAVIRSVIVVSLTVMPTRGSRPRRIMSGSIASSLLSPAPKHLIRRCMRHAARRSAPRESPARPSRATSQTSRPARRAARTAGTAAQHSRGIVMSMPGAVPCGLAIGRLPRGKHRLHDVSLGHRAVAAAGEQRANVRQRRLVLHQLDARRRGDRLAGEVVGRRPQPAGARRRRRPGRSPRETRPRWLQVVADRRVKHHVDAQLGEPLGEPLAIGVEPLAGGELVANGNDFGTHGQNRGVERRIRFAASLATRCLCDKTCFHSRPPRPLRPGPRFSTKMDRKRDVVAALSAPFGVEFTWQIAHSGRRLALLVAALVVAALAMHSDHAMAQDNDNRPGAAATAWRPRQRRRRQPPEREARPACAHAGSRSVCDQLRHRLRDRANPQVGHRHHQEARQERQRHPRRRRAEGSGHVEPCRHDGDGKITHNELVAFYTPKTASHRALHSPSHSRSVDTKLSARESRPAEDRQHHAQVVSLQDDQGAAHNVAVSRRRTPTATARCR